MSPAFLESFTVPLLLFVILCNFSLVSGNSLLCLQVLLIYVLHLD